MSDAYRELVIRVRGDESSIKRTEAQIRSSLSSINIPVSVDAKKAVAETRNLKQALTEAGSAAERLGIELARGVKVTGEYILVRNAISNLLDVISDSTKQAIRFEFELAKIAQTVNKTNAQVQAYSGKIFDLSKSYGVTNIKIAETIRILTQAGLAFDDAARGAEILAKTTLLASFDDIESSTEAMIATMRTFNLTIGETEKAFEDIGVISKAYAVESADLVEAIKRAGGVFAATGGSVEELLALFTSVRQTTRESAETIATGFRTIFSRLQRPKTIQFFKELGIQLADTEGKFIGNYEAIEAINKGLAAQNIKPGSLKFAQIAEEIGGIRQISRVIPLLTKFSVAEEARQKAVSSGAESDRDAAKAKETLAFKLLELKQNFSNLLAEISQSNEFKLVANILLTMANAATELTRALVKLGPLLSVLGASFGLRFASGVNNTIQGLPGRVFGLATGGIVPSEGNVAVKGAGTDTVPALLTPGEFVVNKASAQAYGYANLKRINRFAKGGPVKKEFGPIYRGAQSDIASVTGSLPEGTKDPAYVKALKESILELAEDIDTNRESLSKERFSQSIANLNDAIETLERNVVGFSQELKTESTKGFLAEIKASILEVSKGVPKQIQEMMKEIQRAVKSGNIDESERKKSELSSMVEEFVGNKKDIKKYTESKKAAAEEKKNRKPAKKRLGVAEEYAVNLREAIADQIRSASPENPEVPVKIQSLLDQAIEAGRLADVETYDFNKKNKRPELTKSAMQDEYFAGIVEQISNEKRAYIQSIKGSVQTSQIPIIEEPSKSQKISPQAPPTPQEIVSQTPQPKSKKPAYVDATKAAEILGVTLDEIKELGETKQITQFADRGQWKFKVSELENYLSTTQKPEPKKVPINVIGQATDITNSVSESSNLIPSIEESLKNFKAAQLIFADLQSEIPSLKNVKITDLDKLRREQPEHEASKTTGRGAAIRGEIFVGPGAYGGTVHHEAGHAVDKEFGEPSKTSGTFQSFMTKQFFQAVRGQELTKRSADYANYRSKPSELFADLFARSPIDIKKILASTIDLDEGKNALKAAGYNPDDLASLFKTLSQQYGVPDDIKNGPQQSVYRKGVYYPLNQQKSSFPGTYRNSDGFIGPPVPPKTYRDILKSRKKKRKRFSNYEALNNPDVLGPFGGEEFERSPSKSFERVLFQKSKIAHDLQSKLTEDYINGRISDEEYNKENDKISYVNRESPPLFKKKRCGFTGTVYGKPAAPSVVSQTVREEEARNPKGGFGGFGAFIPPTSVIDDLIDQALAGEGGGKPPKKTRNKSGDGFKGDCCEKIVKAINNIYDLLKSGNVKVAGSAKERPESGPVEEMVDIEKAVERGTVQGYRVGGLAKAAFSAAAALQVASMFAKQSGDTGVVSDIGRVVESAIGPLTTAAVALGSASEAVNVWKSLDLGRFFTSTKSSIPDVPFGSGGFFNMMTARPKGAYGPFPTVKQRGFADLSKLSNSIFSPLGGGGTLRAAGLAGGAGVLAGQLLGRGVDALRNTSGRRDIAIKEGNIKEAGALARAAQVEKDLTNLSSAVLGASFAIASVTGPAAPFVVAAGLGAAVLIKSADQMAESQNQYIAAFGKGVISVTDGLRQIAADFGLADTSGIITARAKEAAAIERFAKIIDDNVPRLKRSIENITTRDLTKRQSLEDVAGGQAVNDILSGFASRRRAGEELITEKNNQSSRISRQLQNDESFTSDYLLGGKAISYLTGRKTSSLLPSSAKAFTANYEESLFSFFGGGKGAASQKLREENEVGRKAIEEDQRKTLQDTGVRKLLELAANRVLKSGKTLDRDSLVAEVVKLNPAFESLLKGKPAEAVIDEVNTNTRVTQVFGNYTESLKEATKATLEFRNGLLDFTVSGIQGKFENASLGSVSRVQNLRDRTKAFEDLLRQKQQPIGPIGQTTFGVGVIGDITGIDPQGIGPSLRDRVIKGSEQLARLSVASKDGEEEGKNEQAIQQNASQLALDTDALKARIEVSKNLTEAIKAEIEVEKRRVSAISDSLTALAIGSKEERKQAEKTIKVAQLLQQGADVGSLSSKQKALIPGALKFLDEDQQEKIRQRILGIGANRARALGVSGNLAGNIAQVGATGSTQTEKDLINKVQTQYEEMRKDQEALLNGQKAIAEVMNAEFNRVSLQLQETLNNNKFIDAVNMLGQIQDIKITMPENFTVDLTNVNTLMEGVTNAITAEVGRQIQSLKNGIQ